MSEPNDASPRSAEPMLPSGYVRHDDVDLAVFEFRPPASLNSISALFAHATGLCAAMWAPLIEQLPDVRCVGFDARGHGLSRLAEDASLAWTDHGADALAVLDDSALDRPLGIGHSMGATALLIAELTRPGTFGGLWLYEPIIFPPDFSDPDGPNPLSEGARRRRREFASGDDALANYTAKAPLNQLHIRCLAAYVANGFDEADDGSVTLRCTPEIEAATYDMATSHSAWDLLGEIQIPVTVAHGRPTPMSPAELAPLIADRIPHGTLDEFAALGHFGPLQDPVLVGSAVSAWIGDVSHPA